MPLEYGFKVGFCDQAISLEPQFQCSDQYRSSALRSYLSDDNELEPPPRVSLVPLQRESCHGDSKYPFGSSLQLVLKRLS